MTIDQSCLQSLATNTSGSSSNLNTRWFSPITSNKVDLGINSVFASSIGSVKSQFAISTTCTTTTQIPSYFKKIKIKEIREYSLINPLDISIYYDTKEKLWRFSGFDISVYGQGKTYFEAEESFNNSFERLMVGFIAFNNNKLSKKSKEIKENLKKYVDFENFSHMADLISFE